MKNKVVKTRFAVFVLIFLCLFLVLGCNQALNYANSGYIQGFDGARYEGHRASICDCQGLESYYEHKENLCPLSLVLFHCFSQLYLFNRVDNSKAFIEWLDELLDLAVFFNNYMFVITPQLVAGNEQSYEICSLIYSQGVLTVNMVFVCRRIQLPAACSTFVPPLATVHTFLIILPNSIPTDTQIIFNGGNRA